MNLTGGDTAAQAIAPAGVSKEPALSEVRASYADFNRELRINGAKSACILVMALMPSGSLMDFFVYPDQVGCFFLLRLICAMLAAGLWWLLNTQFGRTWYRVLAMLTFFLPCFFISLMIWWTEGAKSPYYAGLNLVLIGLSWVSLVSVAESLISAGLNLFLYCGASMAHGHSSPSDYSGALFFISNTGIIVVTGSWFLNRFRFQEYALRLELDRNRHQLEETNTKLVDLDRAKSTFFANVSHELRTPLTLLIGPLDRLRRRHGQPGSHEQVEMLDIMYNNAMRLLRLINDLLDLVRLDSGVIRVRPEKTDLPPFLEGIVKSVSPMATQRKLCFESHFGSETDCEVWIDRDKVEKIVLNLLFNSFKFTPEDGRVDFIAGLRDGFLVITVRDTGKGISPADLPRVFDRFWQADAASTRRFQGVGIGLALVKELAEAHGGSVEVKSEVDQGTEMSVTIDARRPAESEETAPSEPASEPPRDSEWLVQLYRRAEFFPSHVLAENEPVEPSDDPFSGKPCVLIADDEPEMRRFLSSQLKEAHAVYEARNGSEALELARKYDFVLILLDLMMPGIDGITLTRQLREEPRTASVPIIMLTARADDDSKMQALEAGVTDFLTKPFASSEMTLRCRNLVLQHQLQQRLGVKTRELEGALNQIKETETQLVHQAKMASLGQLSSGLLHEINNPLNFANTAVHLLRKRLAKVPVETQEALDTPLRDLQDGIKRAADIVSGLRSFTHPDTSSFSTVPFKEIVQDAVRFVQVAAWDIAIEIDIPDDTKVWGNRNQLIHLLINLLQNASDSLLEKGAPGRKIKISTTLQNGSVLLSCEDNGKGIKPENLPKVFDAFFTTKPVGAGVGLGLNISYRIVQNHGGEIRVESTENEFCRFLITLKRNSPATEPLQ